MVINCGFNFGLPSFSFELLGEVDNKSDESTTEIMPMLAARATPHVVASAHEMNEQPSWSIMVDYCLVTVLLRTERRDIHAGSLSCLCSFLPGRMNALSHFLFIPLQSI